MRRGFKTFIAFAILVTLCGAPVGEAAGIADAPDCVQLSAVSTFGNAPNGETYGGPVTPDSRYVLFHSGATNMGVIDLNGQERDVFVRDMHTGTTDLVSKTTGGAQVNSTSQAVSITPNGRFALFTSFGDLAGAGNGLGLYLRDRQQGTTTLIVGHYTGYWIAYGSLADMSDDGRFVAFVTAESLVPQDTNGAPDVYRLDRAAGQTILVSVADDESLLPHGGSNVSVSADGNRVAFHSGDINMTGVRDIAAGTTRRFGVRHLRITADGASAIGVLFSHVQAYDVTTGALTADFDTFISGSPAVVDVSASGRYVLLTIGNTLYQVDRSLSQWWTVPVEYSAWAFVSDDGLVSSHFGRRAYLWRGPIALIPNAKWQLVEAGTTKDIRVAGVNILQGSSYSFGEGTTTTVIGYPTKNHVDLRVVADPFARDGPRDLTVTAPISGCRTTKSGLFEIIPRTFPPPPSTTSPSTTLPPGSPTTSSTTTRRGQIVPQVFDMSPAVLRPGTTEKLIVLGNNMVPGVRVEIADVTIVALDYISNRRLEATVVAAAARGPRTVRVVNPDGEYGDSPHPINIRGTEGEFHPQVPYRTYDSRSTSEPVAGECIARIGGLPSGVRAVVANLTVTNPTADSYVTLFRAGTARPPTSNINFRAGETKANLVTFEVNNRSEVAIFNADGKADVVLDVFGYYTEAGATSGSAFVGTDPYRRFDSRIDPSHPLGPDESISLRLLTNGESAAAVLLNVTATNPSATSYLTVWPAGAARPTTSNVNFEPGQTVPNVVLVPVGANGEVSFYNYSGEVDVVVDVLGWFGDDAQAVSNGRFESTAPQRVVDTRLGIGAPLAAVGPQESIAFDVSRSDIPPSASAVVMNVTVDQPTTGGYVTVWPGGSPLPDTSNLNFGPGTSVANLVVVRIGADRRINYFNAYGSTHVIADVVGYFD